MHRFSSNCSAACNGCTECWTLQEVGLKLGLNEERAYIRQEVQQECMKRIGKHSGRVSSDEEPWGIKILLHKKTTLLGVVVRCGFSTLSSLLWGDFRHGWWTVARWPPQQDVAQGGKGGEMPWGRRGGGGAESPPVLIRPQHQWPEAQLPPLWLRQFSLLPSQKEDV